ncbi:MAG: hypothetical protein HY761_07810 [Candidatus Omnitrophica bacterium]|nr:hypothetical protein [Candidatus Omnitrophota bacterium]
MNKKNLFLVFLFVITAVFYLPIVNLPLAPYDEAVILVGAEKVLNGQIPHKDFSSEYPPGQFYTLAAFFRVFGTSIITERAYDLIIKSLLSLSIFLIIRFLSSTLTAIVGWVMSLVWLQHSSMPAYPVYPSMLFIFIGVYLQLLHIKEQKNYYVVLSAVSIVLAVLFRHDLGGYAAIVIAVILILRRLSGEQSWSPLIAFTASGIMAGLPVMIYFSMHSSIAIMFNDMFLVPVAFLEKQALPYPPFSRWNLPFFIFPLVLVTGAITSFMLIKHKKNDSKTYGILLISCIGIICFNQARIRSDIVHLLPVALTGILLAPILLYTLLSGLSLSRWQNRVVYVLFVIVFGITLSKPLSIIRMLLSRTNGYVVEAVNPDIERARYSEIDPDLNSVVAFIKNNTSKNEKIYVGVKNHDQFVFNDVIIYFLAERDSATKHHVLNPGVHTTLKVQEELVNEFKNSPPRLVVLAPRNWNEPNPSSIDSRIELLDNYIAANFEFIKAFGLYEIWMKKI